MTFGLQRRMRGRCSNVVDDSEFGYPLTPTPTAGDGRERPNSAKTGRGQGRAPSRRMAHCPLCGFVYDKAKTRHEGGTFEGNGAGGAITKKTVTGTLLNGETTIDKYGEQGYNKGGGCPLCFGTNLKPRK